MHATKHLPCLQMIHLIWRIGPTDKAPPSLLDWLPARVADDSCSCEDPDAHGDDSLFFAVTQQWRAYFPRMLRRTLACMLPSAVDECRDRFIEDNRPLNSSERNIGCAHLPYYVSTHDLGSPSPLSWPKELAGRPTPASTRSQVKW